MPHLLWKILLEFLKLKRLKVLQVLHVIKDVIGIKSISNLFSCPKRLSFPPVHVSLSLSLGHTQSTTSTQAPQGLNLTTGQSEKERKWPWRHNWRHWTPEARVYTSVQPWLGPVKTICITIWPVDLWPLGVANCQTDGSVQVQWSNQTSFLCWLLGLYNSDLCVSRKELWLT